MTKILAAIAGTILAVSALSSVSAKGPFDLEVSGRELSEPVVIAGPFEYDQLYPPIGLTPVDVATLEGEEPYLVSIVIDAPERGGRFTVFTLDYYPETENHAAALHDANGDFIPGKIAWRVTDEMKSVLAGADVDLVVSEDDSDDSSLAWYLVPAGLVGLVAVGGLGGILLKRRGAP